jgi:hypothetical protein
MYKDKLKNFEEAYQKKNYNFNDIEEEELEQEQQRVSYNYMARAAMNEAQIY